jgi:hypothetical protein
VPCRQGSAAQGISGNDWQSNKRSNGGSSPHDCSSRRARHQAC